MSLVFQYGSNCTAGRLKGLARLNGHAEDLGLAQTVDDFGIAFDVYSHTNACAASDLVPTPGQKAWGILYDIPDDFIHGKRLDGKKTLAQIEGPEYEEKRIRVHTEEGNELEAMTFLVKEDKRRTGIATSAAYVSWIIYGLREHGASEDYISHVLAVAIETNQRAGASAAEQTRLIKTL
jgi:hypothetical protein